MTAPTPNVPLIRAIVNMIELYPENWDQKQWCSTADDKEEDGQPVPENPAMCGTTFCLAGWAVLLTGHVDRFGRITKLGRQWHNKKYGVKLGKGEAPTDDFWSDLGREALGLTANQAMRLFESDAANSVSGMQRLIEKTLNIKIIPQEDVPDEIEQSTRRTSDSITYDDGPF